MPLTTRAHGSVRGALAVGDAAQAGLQIPADPLVGGSSHGRRINPALQLSIEIIIHTLIVFIVARLVAAIHAAAKTWMPGTRPGTMILLRLQPFYTVARSSKPGEPSSAAALRRTAPTRAMAAPLWRPAPKAAPPRPSPLAPPPPPPSPPFPPPPPN